MKALHADIHSDRDGGVIPREGVERHVLTTKAPRLKIEIEVFQLPLSGSLSGIALVHIALIRILSTPSFGITEPDSGIFRLSAAFCRGTSSHN